METDSKKKTAEIELIHQQFAALLSSSKLSEEEKIKLSQEVLNIIYSDEEVDQ